MKRIISFLLVVLVSLGFGLATPASASEGRVVTVKSGDTLSKIAGRNWRAVCRANNLRANCHVRVGQKIRLDTAPAPQGARAAPGHRDADGWFHWRNVGGAPLTKCPNREQCWEEAARGIGLTDADKQQIFQMLRNNEGEAVVVENGTKYEYMSYYRGGRVRFETQVVLDSTVRVTAKRYRLQSGRVVDIIDNCQNWGVTSEIRLLIPPPPPPPPPPETPPEIPPPPAPEPAKGNCWDPKLVIGQEYEPKHDGGSHSRSSFASGAIYKCWRGEHGTHGVGVGFQASMWDGSVNSNLGNYEGNYIGVGPAYEYISDSGYDIEGKLLVGRLTEEFEQGDYSSERKFGMLGVAGVYNNYSRRMRGEKWLPETQVFAFAGVPISRDVKHSWQGKPIEDERDLSKLGVLAQAGIRQWLYEDDKIPVLPYVQLGTFVETPGNWTGSARLGIADRNRICGVGVGVDVDFIHGGSVFGLGWWCDVVRGIRYVRKGKRSEQIRTMTDNPNGYLIVPIGQNLASTPQ